MAAYWFKFETDDDHCWIGLAVGRTVKDVFWAIDEHGNPCGAEVIAANTGSAMRNLARVNGEWEYVPAAESSDYEPPPNDPRWARKKWNL